MAQSAQQPALDDQHRGFDFRLVARPARPCRQDRRIVMRRHLGVAAIDLWLVEAGLDDRDFAVVRHQQPGHAANGGKGSRVGSDPIAEPLRPPRFSIEMLWGERRENGIIVAGENRRGAPCHSQMTPACAGAGIEQIARRS